MKRTIRESIATAGVVVTMLSALAGCTNNNNNNTNTVKKEFAPTLDTEKSVSLEIAGFMANFESLDQVINDFNGYYPNVSISYEQNKGTKLAEYLESNEYVDIIMTSDANIRSADNADMYVLDSLVDLSKENIDTDAIDSDMLSACTVDGKLARIPLAKTMCGMVVNKTLLKNEGIEVPQTYSEFMAACEKLKSKGYTPIQGSKIHAYSDMMLPMGMAIVGNSDELTSKYNLKDSSYAEGLRSVYSRLDEIIKKGYTSYELNSTYPDDNYDKAILKFFEGNVPFWICTTESVSGMKKRESKSETYTANPFEYEFVNVPLGDNGVYDYEEPWYGFSVSMKSKNIDYAVEFLNFMSTETEINKMAEIKGMPSVAKNSSDTRYTNAVNPSKLEKRYVYNGKIRDGITGAIADTANRFGSGIYTSVNEAIEALKERN